MRVDGWEVGKCIDCWRDEDESSTYSLLESHKLSRRSNMVVIQRGRIDSAGGWKSSYVALTVYLLLLIGFRQAVVFFGLLCLCYWIPFGSVKEWNKYIGLCV